MASSTWVASVIRETRLSRRLSMPSGPLSTQPSHRRTGGWSCKRSASSTVRIGAVQDPATPPTICGSGRNDQALPSLVPAEPRNPSSSLAGPERQYPPCRAQTHRHALDQPRCDQTGRYILDLSLDILQKTAVVIEEHATDIGRSVIAAGHTQQIDEVIIREWDRCRTGV